MRPRILFVNRTQYGYHVDSYKYCEYLKDTFDVSYIGWDFNLNKIKSEGVNTIYISREGNKVSRYFRFLKQVHYLIKTGVFDLVFLDYFIFSSVINKLNRKTVFIADVRTGAVYENKLKNYFFNYILKVECSTFRHVSIISDNLAKFLGINHYHLLPLGGESFCDNSKSFEKLHLLYVGSLKNRNILDCVKGVNKFLNRSGNKKELVFTIVGDSPGNELIEINNFILQNNLGNFVKTPGFIHNDKLNPFFEEANIGVSYIPMVEHYTNQPPTKTYEYLLSGLPVIATKTNANLEILNRQCGVLIEDNPDSFFGGLQEMAGNLSSFEHVDIRSFYSEYLWKNIVNNNLRSFILKLIAKS
jgi:glycosyltransferase involved in cell wall biosynthesis